MQDGDEVEDLMRMTLNEVDDIQDPQTLQKQATLLKPSQQLLNSYEDSSSLSDMRGVSNKERANKDVVVVGSDDNDSVMMMTMPLDDGNENDETVYDVDDHQQRLHVRRGINIIQDKLEEGGNKKTRNSSLNVKKISKNNRESASLQHQHQPLFLEEDNHHTSVNDLNNNNQNGKASSQENRDNIQEHNNDDKYEGEYTTGNDENNNNKNNRNRHHRTPFRTTNDNSNYSPSPSTSSSSSLVQLPQHDFPSPMMTPSMRDGVLVVQSVLKISSLKREDLMNKFTCSASNSDLIQPKVQETVSIDLNCKFQKVYFITAIICKQTWT